METNTEKKSEFKLRRDLVSETWVAFSTERKSKIVFHKNGNPRVSDKLQDNTDCPFCKQDFSEQEEDVLIYLNRKKEWTLRVFPNKFPIFSQKFNGAGKKDEGPFQTMDGFGYHEVLVTRDHDRNYCDLEKEEIAEILDAYQERYLDLMNRKDIKYVAIFSNYGVSAGASMMHPHSQIVATPVIDPDLERSLEGSLKYYNAHKECVHCTMLDWELEERSRILFENNDFVVLCPFVSRVSFETRIYPKKHLSYFERITDKQKLALAEAVKWTLSKIKNNLDDVDYNMFLHTAPCDGKVYDHYHWHMEIFPKTNTWAGMELSTGIEVCSILPEDAAEILRK